MAANPNNKQGPFFGPTKHPELLVVVPGGYVHVGEGSQPLKCYDGPLTLTPTEPDRTVSRPPTKP